MENCIQDSPRTFWVHSHAFWPYECTCHFSSIHPRRSTWYSGHFNHHLFGQHLNLFTTWSRSQFIGYTSPGTLCAANLFANAQKCKFDKSSVKYLGFIISEKGIQMNPKKYNTITDWPLPMTVKQIQSFLGFTNFYWWFIHHYADFALPLNALTTKEYKNYFSCLTTTVKTAFEHLKLAFTTTPLLQYRQSNTSLHSHHRCLWLCLHLYSSSTWLTRSSASHHILFMQIHHIWDQLWSTWQRITCYCRLLPQYAFMADWIPSLYFCHLRSQEFRIFHGLMHT